MNAVIMAGGEGTRLRPLTSDRPKPMVPVGNRPVIDYSLDLLRRHGFQEVFLTLQYLPDALICHVGGRVQYRCEEKPLGTAGGVRALWDVLHDTFLVLSGDILTDLDLTALLRFHRHAGAIATLAVVRVDCPLSFGIVDADAGGRVRRFMEKPDLGQAFSDLVNAGIYVLEPEALAYVPPDRPFDFSRHLFPLLLQRGEPVYAHAPGGYWCDIGSLERYLQGNLDLAAGRLRFRPLGEEVAPRVWVGDGTAVEPGARLEGPAVIGPRCIVAGAVARSVVWEGERVGPGAVVQDAVQAGGEVHCPRPAGILEQR